MLKECARTSDATMTGRGLDPGPEPEPLADRLQVMLNAVPEMVSYWSRDLRIEWCNARYAERFNLTPQRIRGKALHELLGDELFDDVLQNIELALAGVPQCFERTVTDPGFAPRRFNISYIPDVRVGQVVGLCVVITDVSSRDLAYTALVSSEERYRALFEHMQTGFALHEIITDEHGRPTDYVFLACNAAYTEMTGLRPERIVGKRVTCVLPGTENDPADWIGLFGKVALTGRSIRLENYSEAIGRWYDVVAYRPAPRFFAVLIQDVTERRQIVAKLAAQNEKLSVTLRSIGDSVITTDERGRIEYLNPVAERLTGWPVQEAAGRELMEVFRVIDEETRLPVQDPVTLLLTQTFLSDEPDSWSSHQRMLVARDGTEYFIADSAAPIRDDTGKIRGIVLVFRDMSEQRQLAREMSYRASHDALTELPNRTEFDACLQRELALAQQTGAVHALLYIDLDQFKVVNDACGHTVGDELLRQLAELLRSCVRSGDTLARLGGDEFGVILSHCDAEPAQSIAQGICEKIAAFRFINEGRRYRIGASIGVVPLDRRWSNATAILQAADVACYTAKESGRNRVHAYADIGGAAQASQGLMRWATRLQEAIEENRFALYCQRIEALAPGARGEHYEILLRMIGEDGGIVLPGEFMRSAERYQLAGLIDRWVLQNVLQWMRTHRDRMQSIDMLSINLSGHSIGDRGFHHFAEEVMREMNADAHKICFEVTETAAISNLADATRFFNTMRVNGCRFALDDFGSGLSSFGYLKTLPVDFLKIDGQFVRNAHNDAVDRATVRCIQEVAHVIGKQTIAEFVEGPEVLQLMRDMGVDFAQGYAIHRPEPIETLLHGAVEADGSGKNVGGPCWT